MRIALVIEHFDPRRGGAEQWATQFASQLLARGHEVHVIARDFGQRVPAMPIAAHRLRIAASRPAFAQAAQAELLKVAPDIIHDMGCGWYCDVFHPHGGSMTALARQKLKMLSPWLRPIKSRVDGLLSRHRQFQTLLERQYIDDGRFMVALSRKVADDFRRFHGVPRQRIRLIYNGVDTERFSPQSRRRCRRQTRRGMGLDDGTLLLLTVTHNFRLKGVPVMLRAVRRLKQAGAPVHLVVVGGKRLKGWVRAARWLGIDHMVSFTGTVDDPVPYYAAADIYAHPTFYDSCSLVVLEALAGGLPVLTSRFNGAAELMTEGREGYIVPDPADLSELLARLQLLFDTDRRRRMGRAARRLALKHTFARNVDQVLEIYEQSLAERAGRRAPGRRNAAAAQQKRPFSTATPI